VVTDDSAIPEGVAHMRAALERTRAVGRQLVGLNLSDATALATRSGCRLRVVKSDGKGFLVDLSLCANRINVETEDGIVVETSAG
jgi:hypothetical protein